MWTSIWREKKWKKWWDILFLFTWFVSTSKRLMLWFDDFFGQSFRFQVSMIKRANALTITVLGPDSNNPSHNWYFRRLNPQRWRHWSLASSSCKKVAYKVKQLLESYHTFSPRPSFPDSLSNFNLPQTFSLFIGIPLTIGIILLEG